MKKMMILALTLTTITSFAANTKKAAPKSAVSQMQVTGQLKWTGYGVGKSHGGQLNVSTGEVDFKDGQLVGGTVMIDMKSLATADSPKLEGHLKSPDFFDVEKFQQATFKINQVEAIKNAKAGEATHKIMGDLTIKGKTNPETFMAVVAKDGKGFKATAKTQIADRTKYDIVYNSSKFKAASALGDKLIEDKIDVELEIKTKFI